MQNLVLSLTLLVLTPGGATAQDTPPTPAPPPDVVVPNPPVVIPMPTAVLEGPDTALAGDLVILSWGKSTGDAFKLVTPKSLDGKILINTTDKQLGFSTRTADEYTFMMIAVNANLDIVYENKTITITSGIPPPPDTDPPPVTPPPPTTGWDDLKQISANGKLAVNDPPTAMALAKGLTEIVPALAAAPNMAEASKICSFEVERILMLRSGDSLKKDWRTLWRIPVNNKLNEASQANRIKAPGDFAAAMHAVALGLQ